MLPVLCFSTTQPITVTLNTSNVLDIKSVAIIDQTITTFQVTTDADLPSPLVTVLSMTKES